MRDALHGFADKKLDQHAVMRRLVAHDGWLVPAAHAAQVLGRTQLEHLVMFGEQFSHPANALWIFTDLASGEAAQRAGAKLGPYEGGVRGAELFARIPAGVSEIVVNHGSPDRDRLHLRAPSFGNVGVWIDVCAFEAKLAGATTRAMTDAVKAYDAYFMAIHAGSILTLANVDGLKNALVLFTAPDSMAALLGKLGPAGTAMQTGQTTGARVFPHIAQMGVDGVVINPMGPGVRRVLTLAELTR